MADDFIRGYPPFRYASRWAELGEALWNALAGDSGTYHAFLTEMEHRDIGLENYLQVASSKARTWGFILGAGNVSIPSATSVVLPWASPNSSLTGSGAPLVISGTEIGCSIATTYLITATIVWDTAAPWGDMMRVAEVWHTSGAGSTLRMASQWYVPTTQQRASPVQSVAGFASVLPGDSIRVNCATTSASASAVAPGTGPYTQISFTDVGPCGVPL